MTGKFQETNHQTWVHTQPYNWIQGYSGVYLFILDIKCTSQKNWNFNQHAYHLFVDSLATDVWWSIEATSTSRYRLHRRTRLGIGTQGPSAKDTPS